MGELVLTDAFVSVDGVDLSNLGTNVGLDLGRALKEKTAFSDVTENFLAGLKTNGVSLEFNQDYAASKVDATLHTAWTNGTAIVLTFRPTSGVVSVPNPQYSGNMLIENYNQGGGIGETSKATATFKPSDGTGLARTTS